MTSTRPSRRSPVASDKRFRKNPTGADHGTPERWQHAGRALQATERAGVIAAKVSEEHILDVLVLKNIIDTRCLDAALRFKNDYHMAAIASRVTGSYSGMANMRDFFNAVRERSEGEEAAYRRWRGALAWLSPRQGAVVVATTCHDMPPTSRDIAELQDGLAALAKGYGIGVKLSTRQKL